MPLPAPLPPDVTVIQFALLTAVQAQPAAAVTEMIPLPPLEGSLGLAGLSLKLRSDPGR